MARSDPDASGELYDLLHELSEAITAAMAYLDGSMRIAEGDAAFPASVRDGIRSAIDQTERAAAIIRRARGS